MKQNNMERVGRVLDVLKTELAPFVVREYQNIYADRYVSEIDVTLTKGDFGGLPDNDWSDQQALISTLDVLDCLNLMKRSWYSIFRFRLERRGCSYVHELIVERHNWAHQVAFSHDEAYRVSDTAARLLTMIGARRSAAEVDDIARGLRRRIFASEAHDAIAFGLMESNCHSCGHQWHGPIPICPECGSLDTDKGFVDVHPEVIDGTEYYCKDICCMDCWHGFDEEEWDGIHCPNCGGETNILHDLDSPDSSE